MTLPIRHIVPAAAGAAVLLLAAPAAAAAQNQAAQDRAARVDSIFSFIPADAPGCAVGASKDGRVVVNRTYGLANVEKGIPLSRDSKFDIGSTHKQFVAAAVLLLAQDGRLALTDDIRKHVPELPDYGHTITVDHLLTHTSGIRDWVGLLPLAPEGTEVLELVLKQRGTNFAPGEEWSYSNSGYVLLKEIVARASGMSFADFTRTRIFEPLGMTSTAYVEDVLQGTGEVALAYEKEGDSWKQFMRLGNERGGGGVISTARDLLTWNEALATDRLGRSITARLEEPARLNNGRELTYARGLMVDERSGDRMVWHSGGAAGYSTWLGRFPGHRVSVAVLCNREPVSATALAGRVSDLFLPPPNREKQAKPPVAAEGVNVAGRAGLYLDEATGEPMRLAVDDGRLTIVGGPPLIPVSGDRFLPPRGALFFRSQDEFEITFRSDDAFELKSMEGQTSRYRRAEAWTPTAADLESAAGRYHAPDLISMFEIVPAEGRLVLRFAETPEKAITLEPVARDTWMFRRQIVRFRRDAAGNVTGFDYTTPAMRDVRLERVGDLAADSPPVAGGADPAPASTSSGPATPAPASVPPLDKLVGEYEMMPGRVVTVTLEGGKLYGEPTGNPKRQLVHLSGTSFDVAETSVPMTVTFTLGADGRATAMVMSRNGSERTLQRVR